MYAEQKCSFKICFNTFVFLNLSSATTQQQRTKLQEFKHMQFCGFCFPIQVKWASIGLDFLKQFSQLHFLLPTCVWATLAAVIWRRVQMTPGNSMKCKVGQCLRKTQNSQAGVTCLLQQEIPGQF